MVFSDGAVAQSVNHTRFQQRMASVDARFDNLNLDFTKTGSQWIEPSDFPDFIGTSPKNVPDKVSFSHHERFVVRGKELTRIADADPGFEDEDGAGYGVVPHTRWTNRGDHVLDVQQGEDGRNCIVTHLPESRSYAGTNRHLWPVQFALGFGFGQRIKSITSVEKNVAGLTTVNCILNISDVHQAECEMTIDGDFIVRSASLKDVATDAGWRKYEIETKGTITAGAFRLAEQGSYAESIVLRQSDGSLVEKPARSFTLTNVTVKSDLSDSDYELMTTFDIPEKHQENDPHGVLASAGVNR